ncbi:MAG: alpha/beta hydrolase, partial [Rhodocyclaceae bacterium]|nr:alpha/beta hydrolase [Rhodocyclaceae bacterium]
MDDADAYYEGQYNNRLSIPDAADYNARGVARSTAARARLASKLDLAYGPSARQRIDLYPAATPGAPILSFIHGGYWRSRDKSEFAFVAEPFVAAGITVAMPEYDLTPAVTVGNIVEQMVAAHAWLYRHAGEHGADASRLFIAGHSAGGHLAAMMAATRWTEVDAALPADLVK